MQPGGATVERYVLTIAGNQPTDFSVYRLAIVSGAGSTMCRRRSSTCGCRRSISRSRSAVQAISIALRPVTTPRTRCRRIRCSTTASATTRDFAGRCSTGCRNWFPVSARTTRSISRPRSSRPRPIVPTSKATGSTGSAPRRFSRRRAAHRRSRGMRSSCDYPLGDGASARVFARFDFHAGVGRRRHADLDAGTPLLVRTDGPGAVVPAADYRVVLARGRDGLRNGGADRVVGMAQPHRVAHVDRRRVPSPPRAPLRPPSSTPAAVPAR